MLQIAEELFVAYLLDGIKVAELASFLAGPGAATLMADYGAEVIKVEPPGGDGYRRLHGQWETDYNWQLTSRNKLGVSIDIRKEAGLKVLLRLLESADVLVTNFRNDQLEKYGIPWESLHERFPRLIVAQLTGYGNVGPDRLRRGYDSTAYFARGGMLQLLKPKGGTPVFPPGGVGDHSTAMSLFAGVMMALFKREKEGEGSFVETSLIANGCWANGMSLQGAIAGFDLGELLEKSSRSPFANVYETRDQRFVILVFTNPLKEWPEFAQAMGHPEWLEDENFSDVRNLMKNREQSRELFASAIGSMTLEAVCLALDEYNLTFGVVEGLKDVIQDAHLVENGVLVRTESEDPNFEWTLANPIKMSDESCRSVSDPPRYGEHTREVLSAHGFSDGEISNLIQDQAVFADQGS